MNEQLQQLKELTALDATIVQTREQLARYPVMLGRLDSAEGALLKTIEEAGQRLEVALRERRPVEKEVATLEAQIHRYHDQQAAVKTNKEYQAINQEIEALRTRIDQRETVALEFLEEEESLQKRKKAAAAQLASLKAEHDAERGRIKTQIAEKQERLERLGGERRRNLAGLAEDIREIYELLNQRFQGSAVVPLEGDTCGGCHWSLVAQTCQHVRAGRDLVRCEHCHRYLFQPGNS